MSKIGYRVNGETCVYGMVWCVAVVLCITAVSYAQDVPEAYVDKDYRFRVTPPAGWSDGNLVEHNVAGELRAVWVHPSRANITVFVMKPEVAPTPEELVAQSRIEPKQQINADIREAEVRKISGMRAMWFVFAANGTGAAITPTGALLTVQHWVAIPREDNVVVFMLTAPQLNYRQLSGVFAEMIETVKIEGRQTLAQSGDYSAEPLNRDFEAVQGNLPMIWSGGGEGYTLGTDDKIRMEGARAARIRKNGDAANADAFGTLVQAFSAERYTGKRIRYTGQIKTEALGQADWAALWLRVNDKKGKVLVFDNIAARLNAAGFVEPVPFGDGEGPARGAADWRSFAIEADIPTEAHVIQIGVLLHGKGTAWFDDLDFEAFNKAP